MPTVQHPFLHDGVEARAYQIRSLERCLSASTLMVMPTGFGKTAVEWMVMAEYLRRGVEKIILIAPTTGLVDQQRSMAQQHLKLPHDEIVAYTGETAPGKRKTLWEQARVLMATPQVIRNDAQSGTINLSEVGLLIVDEAHHATGNHAYAQVGKLYRRARPDGRILAATASPGSNARHIDDVQRNLGIQVVDVSKRDEPLVKPFDVDMNIHEEFIELPPSLGLLITPLEEHFLSEAKHLQQLGFLAPKEHISSGDIEKAQLRASRAIQQRDVRGYDAARRVADLRRMHMLVNLLKTQGTEVAHSFLERAEIEGREGRKTNRLLSLPVIHELRKSLADIEELHPKTSVVERLVRQEIGQKPDGKILVFTEFRDTVSNLVARLSTIEGLKPDKFIGQSSRGAQKGMTQKQQLAQLKRFREGEINVLVATSVGEEGLDVPAADLVILYEPVPSAIRAIQRRGRTARQRAGSVHVLITKETRDVYIHSASKHQERNMHRLVDKMVRQKKLMDEYGDLDGLLDPFDVSDKGKNLPAAMFLEQEKELHKPEESESVSQPGVSPRGEQKHTPRTAPPLTPEQRRPKEQRGLYSFIAEPKLDSKEQKISEPRISVVLNAADEEISSINSVKGEDREILIDHREMNSTLPSYLASLGFKTRITRLPHGDLRLSERILIERKTARDLMASIKDGRLLSQCRSLRASASRPMLLIETGGDAGYGLHPNAVLGALAHITLDMGIPVMMTKDAMETAHFVSIAAQREQDLLESFHEMVNSETTTGTELKSIMEQAAREIDALLIKPEASHPWLESAQQQLERCYEHALSQLTGVKDEERGVMNAFSPHLGALFTATEEILIKETGCGSEIANRVLQILKKNSSIKSQ